MAYDDLKKCQAAGWLVVGATDTHALCKCPSFGCGLKFSVPYGTNPPRPEKMVGRDPSEKRIESSDEMRKFLRYCRQERLLSIPEIEQLAGLAHGHIAKAEKDDPSRRNLSIETVLYWAGALGYDLVLKPSAMPNASLRVLAESIPLHDRRRRENARSRRRPSAE